MKHDYQVPPEYVSPTLTPPSDADYRYVRECKRGHDDMNMGFLLVCGGCGWLIDACEPYWVGSLQQKCYHTCCMADLEFGLAKT